MVASKSFLWMVFRVAAGKWWNESDTKVTSGEALMRQITWGRVDHSRTARRGTAEPSQGWERSGLIVVAAAVLAFVVCLTNFALGNAQAGVAAAILGLLAFGAGLSWLGMDRRRLRDAERRWRVRHPTQ
jgi:hypothetical protein